MYEDAIYLKNVKKQFNLYRRNIHRVFETIIPFCKQLHTPFFALNGVDLSVQRGETVGIIGRNGSGKSTMLQIICGILQPTSGEVHIDGRISALLELGAGFNPEFNGRDNIYLSTSIMGLTKQETDERLDQIIAFADIGEFIDQPVKMYSSGMFVRLAFATAISVDPDILIVDEALAVGDIFFQQKCINHMKKIMEDKTIVLVTHDMQAVTNLCDRVALLEHGEIIFDGDPIDAISQYTKLVHNEHFQEDNSKTSAGKNIEQETKKIDTDGWVTVPESERGGALEVEIKKVRVVDENEGTKETVVKGDRVILQLIVEAKKTIEKAIIGYTVKDRLGNSIFGENTCSSLPHKYSVSRGTSLITYEFLWPEVFPETYTLTLGIGEGDDPFVHKIHCWAHNTVSVLALSPDKQIHGIFNNSIVSCEVNELLPD